MESGFGSSMRHFPRAGIGNQAQQSKRWAWTKNSGDQNHRQEQLTPAGPELLEHPGLHLEWIVRQVLSIICFS